MTENIFICPICAAPLVRDGSTFRCGGERVHCYDVASSGYVNLLPPGKMKNAKAGDQREMLRARVNFLSTGKYDKISHIIAEMIGESLPERHLTVLDAGCGEGHHICNIAEKLSCSAVGIDASKHGAEMGAKTARRRGADVSFAAGNIFSMPLSDKSVDAVVSMFAPVPAEEAARVLVDDGVLCVCASGRDHLIEMRQVIYDEVRDSFTGIKTPEGFELAKEKEIKYKVTVEGDEIKNLFTMTPFYHRSPWQGRERLAATESLEITVNCVIHIYRKIREM